VGNVHSPGLLNSIGFDEAEQQREEAVEVRAVFMIDPHFGFVPDWM